ncbi:MAG: cytochrome c peroxidase [Novosphingobium sp.]
MIFAGGKRRLGAGLLSMQTRVCWGLLPVVAGCGFLVGQGKTSEVSAETVIEQMLNRYRRPTTIPAPADNPITPAKVELGRILFFDPRLSASGTISCASCHNPELGWQDGQAKSLGDKGVRLPRHTPTLLNVAWSEPLFWDGRADTLEQQATGPLMAKAEMNMTPVKIVSAVRADPDYRAAFAAAFPGQLIGMKSIVQALASYQRTIVSGAAPFDRWVNGDSRAVPDAAKRGFVIFNTKAKCASCHSSWRFTDDGFHDIGIPGDDLGRARVMPGISILERAFKTPTLRNVSERGPYMHDGSLRTLEQVVDHYDHGFVRRASLADQITPLALTAEEKADLIAFMNSLSSSDERVAPPNLPRGKRKTP